MPNVFLEAWARSIPVASLEYDPDGRIEARALGVAARGSTPELINGLRRIHRDPELRATLGRNGAEYVREVHDPAVVGDSWAELLRQVERH
jgi:glycosyltransferase involved in cell wall biosynthesis